VRGVNIAGTEVAASIRTFEICLRCHGDSPNQPPARTPRQHDLERRAAQVVRDRKVHTVHRLNQYSFETTLRSITRKKVRRTMRCATSATAATAY
jgi:hypothetical protein